MLAVTRLKDLPHVEEYKALRVVALRPIHSGFAVAMRENQRSCTDASGNDDKTCLLQFV